MNKFIYKTPEGTRDLLFRECEIHNCIKNKLSSLFVGRGYNEVITPALENYDLFSMESAGLSQEEMYKLTSSSGHLLVLRPDITMPIARLVATRLREAPLPIRLHYTQKVFRVNPGYKGRSDEITQSGIELIGAGGIAADLEIIHTAARCFEVCGISDYKIEIGHAGVFKSIVEHLTGSAEIQEEIRLAIESKNYSALEDLLETLPKSAAAEALKRLPRLFGGAETIESARELFGGIAEAELDYTERLFESLEPTLGSKIAVDLGLVHRNNYYTGIVFRGYATGSGDTAVSGGRYDTLFGEFGLDFPAVGFAVDNNVIAGIMLRDFCGGNKAVKRLVYPKPGFEIAALEYIDKISGEGEICELMDYDSVGRAADDARLREAGFVVVIGETAEISEIG